MSDNYHLDADLVEACCMGHDLGHPPFGHAGERSLHCCMGDFGGFEGNAQTLRLLSATLFSEGSKRRGMKPTRALLDGVLKYKRCFGTFQTAPEKHFLYDDQDQVVKFVAGPADLACFESSKSIECRVMDYADDIAYALGDLMDGVRAKFITAEGLENWARDRSASAQETLETVIKNIRLGTLTKFVALSTGKFIRGCSLVPIDTELSRLSARYKYRLKIDPDMAVVSRLYREIAPALVFGTPQVQQLEFKGARILDHLFRLFQEKYCVTKDPARRPNLLPQKVEERIFEVPTDRERARLICDHLAGMSDDFAVRTYRRLFDADYGSIVDLV